MVNINMDYPFDCTQLIAVSTKDVLADSKTVCESLSGIFGGAVLTGDEIQLEKKWFADLFCDNPIVLFEFKDQEFQGEFEDWEFVEQIPDRIDQFIDCVKKLFEYGYDVLKIFIIQTPSTSDVRVFQTTIEPLSKALFIKSLFYTGDAAGCETLVIGVKK